MSISSGSWRIVFMGTPAFAVPALRACLTLGAIDGRAVAVAAVVTQPDRPAGRGGHVRASPLKTAALEAGVPVFQPERLRRPEHVAVLRSHQPDLIVVAAFAQILSPEILAIPAHGCLNVHASLLPRWRGAAPISAAILAGDAITGVTIMKMDAGLDTGPTLAMREEPMRPDDTTATLTERLATLGAALLAETVAPWLSGHRMAQPQDEAHAMLTRPLRRADGLIDWASMPAAAITRMIRAYTPWPGAYTAYGGRTLKLWQAEAIAESADIYTAIGTGTDTGVPVGRVLTRDEAAPLLTARGARWPQLVIACVDGALLVRQAQLEGKRPLAGAEFMRGQQAIAGAQLG